jgi:uncharacterized membrane protein (UPF0136 family)
MSQDQNPKTFEEIIKPISAFIGLMALIFGLLAFFFPSSSVALVGTLFCGLVLTVIVVLMGKLDWVKALITWLAVSLAIFILFQMVARPATVMGAIVDSDGNPVAGLTLVLTDSSGIDHKAITDENGAFEIRNIPEGKYTISTMQATGNDELLISGRVSSGWERIMDSTVELGSLVHKTSEFAAVTTPIATAINSSTPIATPIPPTNTALPVTNTSTVKPPTDTPKPPTDTSIPEPTVTSTPNPTVAFTPTNMPNPTIASSPTEITSSSPKPLCAIFPFKVDDREACSGRLEVEAGEHTIKIGSASGFYSNPYLMYDAVSLVQGRQFFQTNVTDEETFVLCLPKDGALSMGEGSEGLGGDLRSLSCP